MFICWFVIFFFFIHYVILCIFFFFFQAEDGIRDWSVTGIQTCALPICENGEKVRREEIPADLRADADAARETMLDAVSLYSDELTEAILEEKVTEDLIHDAVRKG